MKRILMRAGKHPMTVMSPETTLATNPMGGNIGNLLFSHSSHRMLSRSDTEVVAHGLGFVGASAEQISADYDHLVLPMANAFRPAFRVHLDTIAALIEKLTIPVTVLSVGAQASLLNGTAELSPLDESVLRFCRAVLEKSPSIGVRGETTAQYLTDLGVPDVHAIGCPSSFLRGPGLRVEKPSERIDRDARVAFSVTSHVQEMGPVTMRHLDRFPNLTYVPQDVNSLDLMLWGTTNKGVGPDDPMPFHPSHPVFKRDLARFFVDPAPWIEYLSTVDFAFGARIHGNMAAILGGTPALLLAHDSRTLELARYHSIPYVLISDLEPDMDAVDFYAMADFTAFNDGQAGRWATFEQYLRQQGLDHAFDEPEQLERYDTEVSATEYPPPVRAISRNARWSDLDRVDWLYRATGQASRDAAELATRQAAQQRALESKVAALESQVAALERRIAALTAPLQGPRRAVRKVRTVAKRSLRRLPG